MLDKKTILFSIDEELLQRLENYRFSNHINSRSQAIRRLLDESLRHYEVKDSKKKK